MHRALLLVATATSCSFGGGRSSLLSPCFLVVTVVDTRRLRSSLLVLTGLFVKILD